MARKTGILHSLRRQGFDKSSVTPFTRGAHVGCSQCEALVINGIACHETSCPNKPTFCGDCGEPGHRSCDEGVIE